jgi:hypothetical protein
MNKIRLILFISIIALASCKKDNYDAPTAGLSGNFIDAATHELVPMDIIRGTQIEFIEHGYANPATQTMIIKNDGTYANTLMFANTYTIKIREPNFIPIPEQEVVINGQTKLDFQVTPYIRVKDVSIVKNGTKVVATFKLQQNVINNVSKIGLYAHSDSRVGEPMRLVAAEQTLNAVTDPAHVYTIEIDLPSNSTQLKPGNDYYFRVGALIGVGGSKPNYAPAVKLGI